MEALLEKIASYGTGPFLLVVAFLLGWLVKEIKENGKKDEERAEKLRAAVTAQMLAMEARFEERFSVADKKLDELSTRVSCVERDYLPREEHYKEFSGWRAEINRLYDLIVSIFKEKR